MKNAVSPVTQALWLDPTAPLGCGDRAQLVSVGWGVCVIKTLDEIDSLAMQAQVVIVRLRYDTDTLRSVQEVLARLNWTGHLICRIDNNALELAVAASKLGVEHILAHDDWSAKKWRPLAKICANPHSTPSPSTTQAGHNMDIPRNAPEPAPISPCNAVFVDPASQQLLALTQRVAQAEVTTLLVGPTGSGKEIFARVLHESSPRASGPFVAFNCAALPDSLIEDMLFGHEKGAFTGAHREHRGLFEQAQGGTLFLDEIGDMPLHLQSKLLRVLQERELSRLGGQNTVRLNVRIIAATNRDLRQSIALREFREDLYFRIATFRLRLLPLAERTGDILPLIAHCLSQHTCPGQRWHLTPDAQRRLLGYPWPGNVRELENVIQRAVVLCANGTITESHLLFDDWLLSELPAQCLSSDRAVQATPSVAESAPFLPTSVFPVFDNTAAPAMPDIHPLMVDGQACLQSVVKKNEYQVIMATLAATRSRTEAAEQLGISPRTLRYKLAQLRDRGFGLALAD